MKNPIRILILLMIIFCFGCSSSNSPTNSNPNPNPNPNQFPKNIPGYFYSENVIDTYITDLALPDGYDQNNSQGYHTIYLLDSDRWFDIADSVIGELVNTSTIPPVILIGVRSPSEQTRARDFFYPHMRSQGPSNGHADNFYNFLKLELIPFVDSAFNSQAGSNGRTLIGWSGSGYFVIWDLFNYNPPSEPLMFHNYLTISPGSFWWDNYNIIDMIDSSAASSNNNIPANLFMTIGEFETDTLIIEWNMMDSIFSSKPYTNFNYQSQYFQGTEHFSTIPAPSISSGLTWFFGL